MVQRQTTNRRVLRYTEDNLALRVRKVRSAATSRRSRHFERQTNPDRLPLLIVNRAAHSVFFIFHPSAFILPTVSELNHLELLAQIDHFHSKVVRWETQASSWEPVELSRAILKRVLGRVQQLRVRLEAPLVVATFGGTGTGKSSLVNALLGEECTPSGRQRPTTRKPILLAHPKVELDALGLPVDQFEVVRRESDLLRDLVLVDRSEERRVGKEC